MKTVEVKNYKKFVVEAAKQYNTTVQQVQKIVEELDCSIICQLRKMYGDPYKYMMISREDIYRVVSELQSRGDNLQRPEDMQRRKRVCKDEKLEWLIDQGAEVDVIDAQKALYSVSMYNHAIVKKFNLNCGMKNIQDYFDRCFKKHPEEHYDENGKLILESKRASTEKKGKSKRDVEVNNNNKTIEEKEEENTTNDLPNTNTGNNDISPNKSKYADSDTYFNSELFDKYCEEACID